MKGESYNTKPDSEAGYLPVMAATETQPHKVAGTVVAESSG